MAFKIDVTKKSGLKISYIKIAKISINYVLKQSIITLEEYISEEFRNKAKEQIELKNKLNELQNQISTASDTKLYQALLTKINYLQESNKELLNSNYSVGIKEVSLNFIQEDTSVKGYYNELKKIDDFKEADMI